MSKWKIGCGGLIAVVVLLTAIGGWWPYDARPRSIVIRNESSREIWVSADASFCGSLETEIAPGKSAVFQDGWLRCSQPPIVIYRDGSAGPSCLWDEAYANQPVVVTEDSVSCDRDGVATTGDDDPSPTPGGVPDENGPGRGI